MTKRYPALAHHAIPSEILFTDVLVDSLMRIAETKPLLDEYLGTPQEVSLLRRAKVRAITYSNAIEGNSLKELEVTAVLAGKKVAGTPKDVREVQNYQEALDYVERLAEDSRPLKLSDMC